MKNNEIFKALRTTESRSKRELLDAAADLIGKLTNRLRELAEADKDGRVVVLPCKIGATVYVLIQDSAIFCPETNGWYIGEDTIDVIAQDGFYLGAVEDVDFRPNDAIGETVFLTREEAEKALEAMKDGN